MNIKTKITFKYTDARYARISYNSLILDNENFIKTTLEDNLLICHIENENISTVLNTIEDLIHCEKVVELTCSII